jgi:hypothetical protein
MRSEIRRRGVKATEELRIHVKERLRLSLGRFARHIGLVRMYLRDVNGTRGGLGKKCRIVVELPPRGRVVVSGANKDISAAIADTATRAGFAVKRHVKRRRAIRRPPRRPAGRVPLMAALAHVAAGGLPEASGSNGEDRDDPQKVDGSCRAFPCARRPAAERVAQCLGPHRQGGQRSMRQEQAWVNEPTSG